MNQTSPAVDDFIIEELLVLKTTEDRLARELRLLTYEPTSSNRRAAWTQEMVSFKSRLEKFESALDEMSNSAVLRCA